jgi:hypothetical protein
MHRHHTVNPFIHISNIFKSLLVISHPFQFKGRIRFLPHLFYWSDERLKKKKTFEQLMREYQKQYEEKQQQIKKRKEKKK